MGKGTERKRSEFARLHADGCFVIPNPWDVGSAKILTQLGFKALASTSSGLAWSKGKTDGQVTVDEVLAHLKGLVSAVPVPINADFEDGYADDLDTFAENVAQVVQTGVAGFSIEDAQRAGEGEVQLRDIPVAVERIRRARAVVDQSGSAVLLTGRAEGFIRGRPDLPDVIARLRAYADAGADCLYAPGIDSEQDIIAVVQAVAPKPVNVLVNKPGHTVSDLAALGVRRISIGGTLARSAWGAFMRTAQEIATDGTFERLGHAAKGAELDHLMSD